MNDGNSGLVLPCHGVVRVVRAAVSRFARQRGDTAIQGRSFFLEWRPPSPRANRSPRNVRGLRERGTVKFAPRDLIDHELQIGRPAEPLSAFMQMQKRGMEPALKQEVAFDRCHNLQRKRRPSGKAGKTVIRRLAASDLDRANHANRLDEVDAPHAAAWRTGAVRGLVAAESASSCNVATPSLAKADQCSGVIRPRRIHDRQVWIDAPVTLSSRSAPAAVAISECVLIPL